MMPDIPASAHPPLVHVPLGFNGLGFGEHTDLVDADTGELLTTFTVPAPADAPADVREAVQVREDTLTSGRCTPCGAVTVRPNRTQRRQAARTGQYPPAPFTAHAPTRPGHDLVLADALARWQADAIRGGGSR